MLHLLNLLIFEMCTPNFILFCRQGDISEKRRSLINRHLAQEIPIDVKPLDPDAHFRLGSETKEPKLLYWVRAKGHIGKCLHI